MPTCREKQWHIAEDKKKNGGRSERSNGNGKWDYVQAKGKDSDGEGNESIIYQEQRKKRAQEEVQHGCKVQMRDALKKNIKYFMQMGGGLNQQEQ